MKQQSIFRWPRLTSMPLAVEITLILVIKFAIIFLLWKAFFSKPQAKKMLVPMQQMEQHFLSGAATNPVANQLSEQVQHSPSHSRQEEQHGSN
jgi:hypothetical protein